MFAGNMELYRKGTFKIQDPIEREGKCGAFGLEEYLFEVWISGRDIVLSGPDFFIIDNRLIDEYFSAAYCTPNNECVSCEIIALRALSHFKNLFRHIDSLSRVGVETISVKISTSPESGIKVVGTLGNPWI